jgi:hypothetical protein
MRMNKHHDIWATYDPQKARESLRKSAGALQGVDIAALNGTFETNGDRIVMAALPSKNISAACQSPK